MEWTTGLEDGPVDIPGLGTFEIRRVRARALEGDPVEWARCMDAYDVPRLEIRRHLEAALTWGTPHTVRASDAVVDLLQRVLAQGHARMGSDGVLFSMPYRAERSAHGQSITYDAQHATGVALAFRPSRSLMQRLNPDLRTVDGERVFQITGRVGPETIEPWVRRHARADFAAESGAALVREVTGGPEEPRSVRWVERELGVPLPPPLRCLFENASHEYLRKQGIHIASIEDFETVVEAASRATRKTPHAHGPVLGYHGPGSYLTLSLDAPGVVVVLYADHPALAPEVITDAQLEESLGARVGISAESWIRENLLHTDLRHVMQYDPDLQNGEAMTPEAFDLVDAYLRILGSEGDPEWF